MLQALEAFQPDDTSATPTAQTTAAGEDSKDAIVVALRKNEVTTKAPRDALFLAVHVILQEVGECFVA
jgi:hypothetical protein